MIVLTFGIILIGLNILTSRKFTPLFSILIIALILCFQDNCQNDFLGYQEDYRLALTTGHLQDFSEHDTEPLWLFLVLTASRIIPWWMFISCLGLFESVVLYLFIKRFSKGSYAWISTILFYFTWNMMGMWMSLLRQGFVVSIMIAAFLVYEKKKKVLWPAILMLIGFLIHNSSMVMIPLLSAYIYFDKYKKEKTHNLKRKNGIDLFPIIVTAGYFLLYSIKKMLLTDYLVALGVLLGDNVPLTSYLDPSSAHGTSQFMEEVSWLIIFYDAVIVFVVSCLYKSTDLRMKWMCLLSLACAFGDMLLFGTGSLPRIIMYYSIFNIVVYPYVVQSIRKKWGVIPAMAFVIMLIGYAIKTSLPWMTSDAWGGIGTYKFVFFQ